MAYGKRPALFVHVSKSTRFREVAASAACSGFSIGKALAVRWISAGAPYRQW
jgi:hypothetical protein